VEKEEEKAKDHQAVVNMEERKEEVVRNQSPTKNQRNIKLTI
jgi:hypothetical protein